MKGTHTRFRLLGSDGRPHRPPLDESAKRPVTFSCDGVQAVLAQSGTVPDGSLTIRGWDFADGRDLDGMMAAMVHTGFQASALGQAIEEVNRMVGRLP